MTRSRPPGSTRRLSRVPYEHPDVSGLNEELQSVFVGLYGGPDQTPVRPDEFAAPTGAFFVAYEDGEPVAMGGWRRLDPIADGVPGDRPVEIKRMYVVQRSRGRGHARAMLEHLESQARAAGSDWAVLVSDAQLASAIGLYRSSGYDDVPPFGIYAGESGAVHLGKRLH